MISFVPNHYVKNVDCIDFEKLKNKNIKIILCDVDNTLLIVGEKMPEENSFSFLEKAKKEGIKVILFSNGKTARIEKLASRLDMEFNGLSKKPFSKSYRLILEKYNIKSSEVAVVGDQLLTDILGGNKMNMFSILVDPITKYETIWTKMNRFIEFFVYLYLKMNKKLIKKNYF
jgi:HAD superfamily phosphatase (TIGR01668 family)